MGAKRRFRPILAISTLILVSAFLGWSRIGEAAHDLGQDCYTCHNIKSGQVWQGSYSVWSGTNIGMSPYSRPISCDVCHTGYSTKFNASSESHHPVQVITGNTMFTDYDNGVRVTCRDCHNADSVPKTPNLNPDLAPQSFTVKGTGTGYPNHDVSGTADNQLNPGDPPHLLSMLSPPNRTVSGSSAYNKVPSSNPATDYAFCLSCHDGSANTFRAVNVKQDYIDKGHYFKTTGGGITAGDRIPCSDCHASHNSPTNAVLFEPDNATFVGAAGALRPSGLTFTNHYNPTSEQYRALCTFCHTAYNDTNTPDLLPTVRGVKPAPRKYGISGHAASDTQSCKQCHNPHKTPGGGPDCLTCHTTGGAAGTTYDYIDAMFKGVGSDNTATQPASVGSLTWSQHGGFVSVGGAERFLYTSPYNTKGTNDCFKCHGDRHNNTNALIDADNTDSYAYSPSVGMQDNTASGITNANAFCLTCHDGNGSAADVQIGNVAPPNVAANYTNTGHGRPQASGAYTVSLNSPAYLKCTDCHEVHGSNHAKLLPAKKNEVTANFTIPSNFPEKTFRSGGSTLPASDIDFADYSSPASGKGFGTTGDPGDQRNPAGASTGFCDACHRYAGRANRGTDNVTNKAHTHEGITADPNQDVASHMNFAKDCLECHDTHGTTNLEMVNTTINAQAVTLANRTQFDPAGSGNAVCNACHEWSGAPGPPTLNVDHNYRTWPSAGDANPEHNPGANCTTCHSHGNTTLTAKFGFPQAACNSCHGAPSDSTGMPGVPPADTGTYHTDANNVIGTRAGDNTAHKIHVNYLVNRRSVAPASTCYVCHVGGGSQESGHPANPTYKDFKSGTQPTAVPYVQVAMDNTGTVLNVSMSGNPNPPTYNGTVGQAADATNGWKSCSNTSCHYALSPSWSARKMVSNYLGVTDGSHRTYPPLTAYGRGSDNTVLNEFRMQTTAGTGATTATQIVIAGTNVTGNVAASGVRVYRDNGDNTFVAASDTPVGSAVSFAADNTATVSSLSEAVNETGANYWIVFTLAGAPTNGAVVNARVSSVSTPLAGGAVVTATNAPSGTMVDTQLPASAVTTSGYLLSAPVSVAGTASDGNSGVSRVDISIRNGATGNYWNGSAFGSASEFWLLATGTTSWSYPITPPADNTFYVRSRATDNAGNVQTSMGTGSFVLDRVRPTVTGASASTDNTHVLVTFSEAVDNTAASTAGNYTIAGLTVSAAVRQADNASVLLTTTVQTGGAGYQVVVDNTAPGVTDLAGNVVGNPGSANFTGYQASTLNVTDGPQDPSSDLYVRGGGSGTGRLVAQQFRMQASSGSGTVSEIVVTKAGAATVLASGARLFRDINTNGTYESGTDTALGSAVSFAGNTATFSSLGETVNTTGMGYLVVVDIDNSATTDGQQLTTQVTGVTSSLSVNNTSTVSRAISMDKTLPGSAITTTSPYTTGTDNTSAVTIDGTASDGGTNPSGVNHVDVSIQRTSDSQYYTGPGWGAQTWLTATGTTTWSYTFTPGADYTLNVQSRSTDNSNDNTFTAGNGNVQGTPTSLPGLVVDRVHPTVVSAAAVDGTNVDVTYSEAMNVTQATTGANYTIAPSLGTVTAVQQSATVFRLTHTTTQTGGSPYSVRVANVNDNNGNLIGTPDNAAFTGYQVLGPVLADGKFPSGSIGTSGTSWNGSFTSDGIEGTGGYAALSATSDTTGSMHAYVLGSKTTTTSTYVQSLGGSIPGGTAITVGAMYQRDYAVNTQAATQSITITLNETTPKVYTVTSTFGDDAGSWQTWSDSTYTTSGPVSQVTITITAKSGNNASATCTLWLDEVYITYGGSPQFAPARATGDTTAISCDTCHQFGPDDATAGYKTVDGFNQYYYAQPGSHAKHGVSLIGGTDPANSAAADTCTICHLAATSTFGSDHMDGAVDLRSGTIGTRAAGPAYSDDGTFAGASRTCSNVYCHAGRQTPQATGQSWGYGASTCGVCHAVTPPYGKHTIHNNGNVNTTPSNGSNASNYDFSCYYCHPSGTAHVNFPVSAFQAAQVSFSGTLGGQTLAGTYTAGGATAGWDNVTTQGLSWTNGSCATYCHTNGQGGAALVTPTWNHAGFPTATCVGCHDRQGASTLLSTRHRKHTDNTAVTGYNFTCDECHTLTVANGSWTTLQATTGRPNHVDGNLTVQFSTTLRESAVAISGTYTQGVDNCANTYCHSDGSSIKNGGTIQANSIAWGTAGPLACNLCHGVGGPASGAPNYTTSGSRRNSHAAHASVTCQTCHSQTTSTGNTITNAANHVNGGYQVSGTGFTYTFNASTGSTCAFTAGCHSGTVTWGTPLTGGCFSCHAGSEVANKPLEAVDGVPNPVVDTQYNSYGHGNSTTYTWDGIAGPAFLYSYTGSPNNGCYECHSSGASHVPKSGTDPYRLGAYATDVDGLCNDCHGPSAANAKKAANALNLSILGHNQTTTGSSRTWPGTNYAYKCVDCHDPHGDANYYMVRSAINNPTSSSDANTGSNSYGTPKDNAVSNITFTSVAGYAANSYAISGNTTYGICEVCHNQTVRFSRTQDNVGTHATTRCTACHSHNGGFKASCNTCHGDIGGAVRGDSTDFPPQGPQAGTGGWAGRSWAELQATVASRGDHLRHAGAAFYGKGCSACHTTQPGSDASHATDKTNASMTAISTYGVWSQGTQLGYLSVTDDMCSNITCHSPYSSENSGNAYMSGTPFAYARYWVDNVSWNCYTCHAYDGRTQNTGAVPRPGGADNTMSTGSHTTHVSTAQMDCTRCHASGSYTVTHKSGFVDWSFAGSPDPYADTEAYSVASGTRAPTDNTAGRLYGTCGNLYCHSNVQTSPPGGANTHSTPTWGTATTGNCGTCHGGDGVTDNVSSIIASGTHTTHVNKTGYNVACTACHTGAGTMTASHADGRIQVPMGNSSWRSFTLTGATTMYDNTTGAPSTDDIYAAVGADASYGKCSSTPCHTNGQGSAPLVDPAVWGATDTTCTYCHDRQGASTLLSTRHRKHTDNTATTGYNFTCDECHTLTVANGSWTTLQATTGRPNHVDGNLTVQFSTTLRESAIAISGTYTQGVDNCANTYCHSDGSSIKNSGTIQSNSIRWDNTTTPLPCNSCHGVGGGNGAPNYTTSGSRRNSHAAHASVTCQTCHSQTTTNGTSITTAANHVNGTYQVSGTGFTYAFNASTGSTCAFTAGCHSGTVTWGTTLVGGCFACHAGAEVANKPLQAVDGIANPVVDTQYNSTGHGNSTTFTWDSIAGPAFLYSYTGAPNNGCYECHSGGAGHIPKSGTDPYRLGGFADNVDGLCNDCHGPLAANPKKALNALNLSILGHNKTTTGSARNWPGTYDYKCVDCHDPHGDANHYMVRSAINNPANSTDANTGSNNYGTPKDNALSNVTFTSLSGFAAGSYAISGNTTYGICEVCHNQTVRFSRTQDNVGTHATNRCTSCHTHDAGFKGAGHSPGANCKGCHNTAQGSRPAIQPTFEKKAAHIDNNWANIASADCEQCHDEQSSDGIIKLKLWGTTAPLGTTITYDNTQKWLSNQFCLGCHDSDTSGVDIWVTGTATPPNIGTRWSTLSTNTKNYSKFSPSTYNVVPQLTKTYNPHLYPGTNAAKVNMTTYRYAARTVSNAAPVACLDCHPAHGSNNVSGAVGNYAPYNAGYSTATGAKGGKMILQARPSGTAQAYAKEEELCWDCHTVGMDYRGDQAGGTLNRWGAHSGTNFTATWGATTPFAFKQGKTFDSSHFYPDKPLGYVATTGYRTRNNTSRTNLSCSTCHDPHGIATADTDAAFRLPILRGTWLSSPYIEDRPPTNAPADLPSPAFYEWRLSSGGDTTKDIGGGSMGARYTPEFSLNKVPNYGWGYGTSGGTGAGGYFIDENTFGTTGGWKAGTGDPHNLGLYYNASGALQTITVKRFNSATVTTDEGTGSAAMTRARFSGLCDTCHTSATIQTAWAGHIVVPGQTGSWIKMFNRPYQHLANGVGLGASGTSQTRGDLADNKSGYGTYEDAGYKWGVTPTATNRTRQDSYHQWPCSKCHTPHASVLPRLMATNCLDIGGGGQFLKNVVTGSEYQYPQYGMNKGAQIWSSTTLGILGLPTSWSSLTDGWRLSMTCHADRDGPGNNTPIESRTFGTDESVGWNRVTPW